MRIISKTVAFGILFWFFIGCEKDGWENLIEDGVKELDFSCYDSTSIYFFRGVFNNDSLCLYDGDNGCYILFGQTVGFVTYKPYFTSEYINNTKSKTWIDMGMMKHIKNNETGFKSSDQYSIRTEPLEFGPILDSLVNAYLTLGTHSLRFKVNDDSISAKGFEVYMIKYYYNPSHEPDEVTIRLSSSLGRQPDGYVDITDVSLGEFGTHVEGYIRMKFKCKMYLDLAGKLTGSFVGDFEGEASIPISYDR